MEESKIALVWGRDLLKLGKRDFDCFFIDGKMPKMKTHSASKKRFKKNSAGKIKRAKAYKRHHAWSKTTKQGRNLRKADYLTGGDAKNIARLLPY